MAAESAGEALGYAQLQEHVVGWALQDVAAMATQELVAGLALQELAAAKALQYWAVACLCCWLQMAGLSSQEARFYEPAAASQQQTVLLLALQVQEAAETGCKHMPLVV